jgi:hypothetical protein
MHLEILATYVAFEKCANCAKEHERKGGEKGDCSSLNLGGPWWSYYSTT